MPNPFTPTAGARPPVLIGRDAVLEDFRIALEDGPGAPGRLSLVTGARGVGKTVVLAELTEIARTTGWVTIDETATPGLLERVRLSAVRAFETLDLAPGKRRALTGFTVGRLGGAQFVPPPPPRSPGLREALEELLSPVEERGSGLLVTIDEVHRKEIDDLRQIAATFQHLVREDRDVALVVAGLPSAVHDLLNDDVLTFLRRADRQTLADVPLDDVRVALSTTIAGSEVDITEEALDVATTATGGYPFMVQLVGYHVWRRADDGVIEVEAAAAGVAAAQVRLGSTVHEANLASLSAVDRTYLVAMAQDDGPSRTSAVAARMSRDMQYQNVYRDRLITAGIIKPAGHGLVDFAVPYLREYLRDHAARYEMQGRLTEE
ncbi:ATP-binding protein [Kineococcus endophyticus]|uniref:ATP-binding protein n=1 Tax=Kineococcus endophyticus TaxID=1181883 RepID=A0ABV3P2R7_9ACTN